MEALKLREFLDIGVEELPLPILADGEVLLKVASVGICGSDIHGFTGENGRRVPGQVMGHEASGWVFDAHGADVGVGTRVTFNPVVGCGACAECLAGREHRCSTGYVIGVDPTHSAAFAQFVAVPAKNTVELPPALPLHLGALIEPIAVAVAALDAGGVASGARVGIVGGGPIGQSLIVAAKDRGVSTAVSERDPSRARLCGDVGADRVTTVGLDVGVYDVVIDAVGTAESLAASLIACKVGGVVVLVGMGSPTVTLSAFEISTRERRLQGSFCYSRRHFMEAAAIAGRQTESLAQMVSVHVDPSGADEAFRNLLRAPTPGKVLIDFSQNFETEN